MTHLPGEDPVSMLLRRAKGAWWTSIWGDLPGSPTCAQGNHGILVRGRQGGPSQEKERLEEWTLKMGA